jgi:hypothetical protein
MSFRDACVFFIKSPPFLKRTGSFFYPHRRARYVVLMTPLNVLTFLRRGV